jgi:DNA-binding winged helix-turn-helix (wHTH) protein/Tol biopolymer transport system component
VFEGFRLDGQRRVLFGADGELIPLTPRPFDALLYFVERPGQLLTKKQLLEAIWPRVVVEEQNLNKAISELRRALGEKPGEHRFFVTKPGHGYRFVAKVSIASDFAPSSPAIVDELAEPHLENGSGDSALEAEPMATGTGHRDGEDDASTLAKGLERKAKFDASPGTVRPVVAGAIDVRISDGHADAQAAGTPEGGAVTKEAVSPARARWQWLGVARVVASTWRRRALSYAAAALLGGAAVGFLAWTSQPPPAPRSALSFATMIPDEYRAGTFVAIARDGSRIGFATPRGPVVRNAGDFALQPVPATPEPGTGPPCFSPDGTWIAYTGQNGTNGMLLKKAPLAGGAALTLASEITRNPFGASQCDWGEDGQVYFTSKNGLMRVAESGGQPELLATPAADEIDYWSPQALPSQKLLFAAHTGGEQFPVYVLNLKTREKTLVLKNAGPARYAATGSRRTRGHLVYGRDGALFAVPIDLGSLKIGATSPVLNGVARIFAFSFAAVSNTGTLAYFTSSAGEPGSDVELVWLDRAGKAVDLPNKPPTNAPGNLPNIVYQALSPDGQRVALGILDFRKHLWDISIYDLDDGHLTRLTFGGTNGAPVWTPDGKRIIYSTGFGTDSRELRSVSADNSGSPSTLATVAGEATSISTDGRLILGESSDDIWVLPVSDDPPEASPHRDVIATTFQGHDAMFSPDGRYIAYVSDESGIDEVYVVPYPGPGGKALISIDGGLAPRWNPNGRELFYVSAGRLMAVSVETTPTTIHYQTPRMLFSAPTLLVRNIDRTVPYSVAPDGARFLMLKPAGVTDSGAPRELRTIVNWFEELRRLAPAR